MPYHIEWTDSWVYWTYSGVVTGEDILQSNFEIYGDERFDKLTCQIVNLLDAESFEVTERYMQKVAHLDAAAAQSNNRIRVAVVARASDAVRLHEIYTKHSRKESWPVELFDTVEAAEAWAKE